MRFIGSKLRLLPSIREFWAREIGAAPRRVGDLFCGTAVVSGLFKTLGHTVIANDNLKLGYVLATAVLQVNTQPSFDGLIAAKRIGAPPRTGLFLEPYEQVLEYLNHLPGERGFFFTEYSPGGTVDQPFQRSYFTDDNAKKIDVIRRVLRTWLHEGLLTDTEHYLLLADLIRAASRVANVAGTYGSFLRRWDPRALRPLLMEPSRVLPGARKHEVHNGDALDLAKEQSYDVLYLDPPYTWRHYGAYYHILETLAQDDEPLVTGRTGLRPWEESRSRFCDKRDAARALRELVETARTHILLLSYNSEGLIDHEHILSILASRGSPSYVEFRHRRYRSNNGGARRNRVVERLYCV